MEIVIWALIGLGAGVAAKFVMPLATPGGLAVAAMLGLVGALVGAWLGRLLGFYRPGQPASFVMAVISALIVLTVFDFVASRRRSRRL